MKSALFCIAALGVAVSGSALTNHLSDSKPIDRGLLGFSFDPEYRYYNTGTRFIIPVPDGRRTILLLGVTLLGLAAIRYAGSAASAKRVVARVKRQADRR